MSPRRVYVATDARAARGQTPGAWAAVLAVGRLLGFLVLAPLELAAAALGLPPVSWTARQIAAQVRADWRRRCNRPHIVTPDELTGVVIPPSYVNAEEAPRG